MKPAAGQQLVFISRRLYSHVMKIDLLQPLSESAWQLSPRGHMRVPAIIHATRDLLMEMDDKVLEQMANIATLPGIVKAAYAMPDAHWGYGFPIGGVAAFDADTGGVVSAGGVGFDISCGVRTLLTGLNRDELNKRREMLADALFHAIPSGVGSKGKISLDKAEMNAMLTGGAAWAVKRGYGKARDLARIEHAGRLTEADPSQISDVARRRQKDQMGTLGSGNHYLEVQEVQEVFDSALANAFGLRAGELVISIHCGSRGLGHQVATEFARRMLRAATRHGLELPDRELACAPVRSAEGQAYLGAMRAAANCAMANRQIISQLVNDVLSRVFGKMELQLLYDVSHNFCALEEHTVNGNKKRLCVHRKGATRALEPGHPDLPPEYRGTGQPVLIGGTMGTASYVLAGDERSAQQSFRSACHGAGRRMSRNQAARQWQGRDVVRCLAQRDIIIRSASVRAVAEEAPAAYKDVDEVIRAAALSGLARPVARLIPHICIKG